MFGFDLTHVVFYAALMAWVHPYLVLDILEGMLGLEPFFKPFFKHKAIFQLCFGVYIGAKNALLNQTTEIFCPFRTVQYAGGGDPMACFFPAFRLYVLF